MTGNMASGGTVGVLDGIFTSLGLGWWTLSVYINVIAWAIVLPYFSLSAAFFDPTVDYWCSPFHFANSSWTREQLLNYSIPWENRGGSQERSKCLMYDRDYEAVAGLPWSPAFMNDTDTLGTRPCEHWEYDTSIFASTVTMEWDLVCSWAGVRPLFQSLYYLGTAVGEPLLGTISDGHGRRTVLVGGSVLFVAICLCQALVPLLTLVLIGRFLLGVLHPCCSVAYVKIMEACPKKHRTSIGLLSVLPFAFTGILFGAWAYLERDWRTLQLLCTIPCVGLLLQIPFMDESPRWLVVQGRVEEATKVLRKAARWHKAQLPLDEELNYLRGFKTEAKEKSSHCSGVYEKMKEVRQLIETPTLRRVTVSLFSCYFLTGITYWGISLAGMSFSKNPFLYMALSSVMELPGYGGFIPFVMRWGCQRVLTVNYVICAASILSILFTPKDYTWTIFTLALIGKLFISGSYNILYLAAVELLPTSLRSRGLNYSSMTCRLGSILAPFVIDLMASNYEWAPSVMFGLCAAVASVTAFLLPNSKGKPMTDTVKELEELYNPIG